MTTAAPISLAPSPASQPIALAWNAWRQLTWAQIRIAALFWLGWGLALGLEMMTMFPSYAAWEPIATAFYDAFVVTCLLLLGIAVADAISPLRRPRWLPYAMAALVAAAAGTVLLVYTEPLVGLYCCWDGPRPPNWVFVGASMGSNLVICALATFGYFHRRLAQHHVATLRGVQLERAQLARRAFEARLQAMQARVEPQFLFNTLAQVERLYDIDARRADRMLDDLIVYLRAALPQLRETTSTLARELELAKAYLNIVEAGMGDRLAVETAVFKDGGDVRVPPMVLLPLIEYALVHRLEPTRIDLSLIHI